MKVENTWVFAQKMARYNKSIYIFADVTGSPSITLGWL